VLDDIFVIDAVTHAFNFANDNFHHVAHAQAITDMSCAVVGDPPAPEYALPREAIAREWPTIDTANMLFAESPTDVAIFHPLPITAFKDGMCGIDKAVEAIQKWPNRFVGAYAVLDPLRGTDAFPSLEEQVELLSPQGLKLYPSSWTRDTASIWAMDDPKVAFPIFEKAAELGIRHIAVHKSIPLGPAYGGNAFHPGDIEGAAVAFPELKFEIVHGGIAFTEETAWLIARYPNLYINMENLNITLARRPRAFAQIMLGLMHVGGEPILEKLFWGTGTMQYHPRPCLEALRDFQFPEDLLEGAGLFAPISQITQEQKRNLLGRNYARSHGLDIEKLRAGVQMDEFAIAHGDSFAAPYSTTTVAHLAGASA
jgi:predicted TIM-barrel fold metal-dependent hydrolase